MIAATRIALLSVVVAGLAANTAGATTPPPVTYDRSCEKTAMTQYALDACASKELAELRPLLASALAAERTHFAKKLVDAAEALWLSYRSSECALEASPNVGGTIYPLVYGDCEVRLTAARIADLRQVVAGLPH